MTTLKPSDDEKDTSDNQNGGEYNSGDDSGPDSDSSSSPDTADEIAGANNKIAKSKKTLKRKRRATEPSTFGAALQSLLDTEAPSALPLSLKPSVARQRNDEKLELRAKKVLQLEKKEKEDKGRITDVIGGWGGESERTLRKVAQRGGKQKKIRLHLHIVTKEFLLVVKLFNVIQQSQAADSAAVAEAKASRGKGKPSLPAPTIDDNKSKGKGRGKVRKDEGVFEREKESTRVGFSFSSVFQLFMFHFSGG
jgi:hypothetical protein